MIHPDDVEWQTPICEHEGCTRRSRYEVGMMAGFPGTGTFACEEHKDEFYGPRAS